MSSTIESTSTGTSFLSDIPMGPPDDILGISEAFQKCTSEQKMNVCVGAYRDENGKPWILSSVKAAEGIIIENPSETK